MKSALHSVTIALIVLFALPISQLRTISARIVCCCPDPTRCHCPDHQKTTSDHDSMRACHKSSQAIDAPTVSVFVTAPAETISVPTRVIGMVEHAPTKSHEAPPLDRPRGPS